MSDFVHLHVHTHYSPLDGLGKPKEYVKRAKELGQSAIAITDHGGTSGLYDMQKEGDRHGVKIILGSEFYFQHDLVDKLGHLVILAKNNNGLKNIYKLQEKAYIDNFYYKPRINIDILKEHVTDIIVLSACLANPIPQLIVEGNYIDAKNIALELSRMFGEDFYLEMQPNSIPEQYMVNKELIRMHKETGIQLIATNDVHYPYKQDGELKEYSKGITYSPHEVLLALQTNKKITDEKRMKFSVQDFWLKSKEEMLDGFSNYDESDMIYIKTAINNTGKIAQLCNARIEKGNYLPHFHSIPKGKTENQLLREIVTDKYKDIIRKKEHNKEFVQDVNKELDIIDEMGYPGYFLIVQDFINWARDNGVVVGDGRGSGAGSKVAYVTGITRINPQRYDLLFERFLSPGRVPDIDSDFADIDKVFEYLQSTYGETSVGRIITFGRLTAKACTRKVFSCFNHKQSLISRINDCMPKRPAFTLQEALDESKELRDYKDKYSKEFELIERLENTISHTAQHAGGIVIWKELSDVLPIISNSDDRSKRIVAFDMVELEELGFYKFDVLGLQTLEVIQRTLDNIKQLYGIDIDLDEIDYEDDQVYDMLCNGDMLGVFQLEEQSASVIEQQPRNFKDLIAINALIRPGISDWNEYLERRRGKKWTVHEKRLPYMEETEGLITYQEQFLLDCYYLAGWNIAFADKHIRKNKNITNDVELKDKFIKDCMSHSGIPEQCAIEVWDEIEHAVSGGYSFNKSHSACYAKIGYKTAWLKNKYPKEFYASLLTQNGDNEDKVANIIAECKKNDINILPPDINISDDEFEPTEEGIRYRLTTIKNVGKSAIKAIRKLRPIESLSDMLERGKKKDLRKDVVENLIKSGVFDNEEPNRIKLLNYFYKERDIDIEIPISMWSDRVKCAFEKESMGMYLSQHPIEKYGFKNIEEFKNGSNATIGGEVTDVARIHDKKGNPMAFVTISNQYGTVKAVVFSYIWTNKRMDTQNVLKEGNLVKIVGRRDGNNILVNSCEVIS